LNSIGLEHATSLINGETSAKPGMLSQQNSDYYKALSLMWNSGGIKKLSEKGGFEFRTGFGLKSQRMLGKSLT
jgi:hypothetical protein